jgi:hypothetical protein
LISRSTAVVVIRGTLLRVEGIRAAGAGTGRLERLRTV